jgi:hypothetical protein
MKRFYNLIVLLALLPTFMFAQQATLGAGSSTGLTSDNAGPIYRSSAGSSFDFSQHYYLYTAAELSAQGITAGSTITKIAWNKTNAGATAAANTTSKWQVYMKNTATAPSSTWCNASFATQATGATLVYSNVAQVIPAATGYITLTFSTPFVYTGGSLEIGVNWDCSVFSGSPMTNGISWLRDPSTNSVFGSSSNLASFTMAAQFNKPVTRLDYTLPAPCAAAPTTVTASASPNTALCPGSAVSLSGSAGPVAGGYTYQWQSSTNGTSWTDIAGATGISYSEVPTVSTYYRLNADCANAPGTPTASAATAQVNVAGAIAAFPYTEGFNTASLNAPGCWKNPLSGGKGWDFVTGVGQGNGPTAPAAGAAYARGDYYNMSTANNPYILQSPAFALPANNHRVQYKYWVGNGSGTPDHLFLEISNDNGATWTTLKSYQQDASFSAGNSPWKADAVVLSAYTSQNVMFRFRGVSNYGFSFCNVAIDEFVIDEVPMIPPTCSAISSPANGFAGVCFNTATNVTWASNPDATSFDIYIGATLPATPTANVATNSYTIPANTLTASTSYMVKIVPKNQYGDAVGCATTTFTTKALLCYCAPTFNSFGCNDGDVIARVILNTLDNNSGTGCPGGASGYSDYTGAATPNLTTTLNAGSTYQCTVYAGQYGETYAAWIDFNDNGDFETSERLGFTATAVAGSGAVGVLGSSATFPLILPCNPPVGNHIMRVRCAFATAGSTISPCGPGAVGSTFPGYGEVEDYVVTVAPPPPCPDPNTQTAIVDLSRATLNWNPGCTETEWDIHITAAGGGAPSGVASNPGVTAHPFIATGLSPATASEYWVRAVCSPTAQSAWVGPFAFTTPACPTLTPANAATGQSLTPTLSWTAVTGATSYDVYLSTTSPAVGVGNLLSNVTTTSYAVITPLLSGAAGTTYYWAVVAKSATAEQSGCNDNTFETVADCNAAPTGIVAAANLMSLCSGGDVALTASSLPLNPGITYQWQESINPGVWTDIVGATATTTTVTGLLVDTKYRYAGTCTASTNVGYSNEVNVLIESPVAGTITASVNNACPGYRTILTIAGSTPVGSVMYEWESGPVGLGTFTTIPGATGATYTTTITTALDYRCIVTCGVTTDYSAPITMDISTSISCSYCRPTFNATARPGCMDGDVIARVTLNTLDNNSGTGCPGGPAGYSDYTASTNPALTTTLNAGTTYSCTVFAGQYSENYAVWIDFNDDLDFDDLGERLGYTATAVTGSGQIGVLGGNAAFSLSLPCNPPVGTHLMRVRCAFGVASGIDIEPCGFATPNSTLWGEVEDYLVTIAPPPPCPQPKDLGLAVKGKTSVTLYWTQGCSETEWDVHVTTPAGGAPTGAPSNPAQMNNNAAVITGLTQGTAYEYWLRAVCTTGSVYSAWTGPFLFSTVADGDEACDAIPLTINAMPVTGFTNNLTAGAYEPSNYACGLQGTTMWFKFVPTHPYQHEIVIANPAASTYGLLNSWVSVYTATSCPVPVFTDIMPCYQGCQGFANSSATLLISAAPLTVGQEYLIYIDDFGTNVGEFNIQVKEVAPPDPSLSAKVFLSNVDPVTGLMPVYYTDPANAAAQVTPFPLTEPYVGVYPHITTVGTTVTNPAPALTTTTAALTNTAAPNNSIVDWVFIQLHTGVAGSVTVHTTRAALLQADGDIVDTDGVSPLTFAGLTPGGYYVCVRHRNHLGFGTANLITLSAGANTLDLTNITSPVLYGITPNVLAQGSTTVYVMNGGDANTDGSLDAPDSAIWQVENGSFDDYSLYSDYNLDGSIDSIDSAIWELNNGKYEELP